MSYSSTCSGSLVTTKLEEMEKKEIAAAAQPVPTAPQLRIYDHPYLYLPAEFSTRLNEETVKQMIPMAVHEAKRRIEV